MQSVGDTRGQAGGRLLQQYEQHGLLSQQYPVFPRQEEVPAGPVLLSGLRADAAARRARHALRPGAGETVQAERLREGS